MQPTNDAASNLRTVVTAGFWRNNMALVQMLGLCPLLAVTTSVVNGLALGLATAGVLTLTNTVISMMRRALIPFVRIPLFVLIIAALVTCIDLLTNALLDDLHQILGLFIPLIVTNCAVLAQAETVASRRPVGEALLTGLATGLGFLAVLVLLGGLREFLGHGTLFAGMPLLAGERTRVARGPSAVPGDAGRDLASGRVLRHGRAPRAAESAHARARGAGARRRGRSGGIRAVKPAKRRQIYERLARANPNPTTELRYSTPFELLVAVVLSAQATDLSVNKATVGLFKAANTPQAMLDLGETGLKAYIKTIGLFNSKAKNLIAACRALVAEHAGVVPREREALEALPGVGRKTANVILNTAFGEATIAVDTHIFRVANRIGLAHGGTVRDGRGRAREGHARRVQAQRASLADLARPLRLQGAQARVPDVHHRRPLRVPRQDPHRVSAADTSPLEPSSPPVLAASRRRVPRVRGDSRLAEPTPSPAGSPYGTSTCTGECSLRSHRARRRARPSSAGEGAGSASCDRAPRARGTRHRARRQRHADDG